MKPFDRDRIRQILNKYGVTVYYSKIKYMPHFEIITITTPQYFFSKKRVLRDLQDAHIGVNFYLEKPTFWTWILKKK